MGFWNGEVSMGMEDLRGGKKKRRKKKGKKLDNGNQMRFPGFREALTVAFLGPPHGCAAFESEISE